MPRRIRIQSSRGHSVLMRCYSADEPLARRSDDTDSCGPLLARILRIRLWCGDVPMTPDEIRFAADGMLQSLATWLRLLGYDCVAGKDLFGRQLLEQAVVEDRVFLTRNAHLPDNLPRQLLECGQISIVTGERLPEQLREVVSKYSLETRQNVFSRCLECNESLRSVERTEAAGQVPPKVLERETDFWKCERCGKTFWRGSHIRDSLQRLKGWIEETA